MNNKKSLLSILFFITAAGTLFFNFACRNTLLESIEQTVEIVITPPEILSIYPTLSAEDVPITLNTITATLSKSIDRESVTVNTFYLLGPDDIKVNGRTTVDNDTITFIPSSTLAVGSVYTVVIDGIRDTDGNAISEKYQWTFTTGIEGDTVIPVISSITINGGDLWTNSNTVEVAISAYDNFGIAQMNVSLTGDFSDAGWKAYSELFTLELPLSNGQQTVYLKLKDGSGNNSNSSVTGQIGLDTMIPEVIVFQIDGGNTGTRNNWVDIEILAQDESNGSGITEYRIHTEGQDWQSWNNLTNGSILLEDQPLTVTRDEIETFYLQVRDAAGNESTPDTRQITMDLTAPYVASSLSNPAPGSIVPQNQAYVKVVFDGEINTNTISVDNLYISKGLERISTFQFNLVDNKTAVEFTEFELGGSPYYLEENTNYTVFVSSAVTDIAGNPFESDYTYSFLTDYANDITAPEGRIVLDLDSPDFNATAVTTFDLMIKASDDFNGVRAVKIWGDNIGTGYPTFESEASWQLYSETSSTDGPDDISGNSDDINYMSYFLSRTPDTNWNIDSNDGDKYIYYKFVDYANNESVTPGRLKISLDVTNPTLAGIQIDSGGGFTKNPNDEVNITLNAVDVTPGGMAGSGIQYMQLLAEASNSVNGSPVLGSNLDWSFLTTGYPLLSGEGKYYIYAQVQDFVGNVSTVANSSIILDYTLPVITFSGTDIQEVHSAGQQSVSIVDPDPGAASYQIPSGIAVYNWEQVSGPGTLVFSQDQGGTVPGSGVEYPYIKASANDGSQDGVYAVKVTATDNSGNSSYSTVPFIWDTIDPSNIGVISAYNADDTALTTSANSAMVYTSSAQPYANWLPPEGADFFTIIPYNTEFDPNSDPGVVYGQPGWYPHWDDDEVDWDNPATYENKNYIKNTNPTISAPAPNNPGDNDGPVYLYTAAWDNAKNRSNRTSNRYVKFWIDTLSPVIININALPPTNSSLLIDYRNGDDLGDGRVYDQRTANDPSGGTQGSGITSYLWEQSSGSGTLTILNGNTLTPTISGALDGSDDGQYQLKLTVTDNAGNKVESFTPFVWDTTAPNSPTVTGISRTPSLTPTWSWFSNGGGGNGYYRYRIERTPVDSAGNPTGAAVPLSLAGSEATAPYWVTDRLDISYQYTCLNNYKYNLFVQEKDEAGNWSGSGNTGIWIDTSYTSEPAITRSGTYLRNATDRQVTWNWTTGLGNPATESYRYKLVDSSSNIEKDWATLSDNISTVTIDFAVQNGGLPDDTYTLVVEEYNVSASSWVGKEGYSDVQIDATAPGVPTFTYLPGSTTTGTDTSYRLTNDTTPTWSWTGGGGGMGSYRWSFDGISWTDTNSNTLTPSKPEGVYTFYVQERDIAGNWSVTAEHNLEIDTTAPALSSIQLKNRSLNAYNLTSYTVSTAVDIDVSGSGANSQTYSVSDIRYMRFWNLDGSKYTYVYNLSGLNSWYFSNGGGSAADGSKYVYCELIDYAGNVSVTKSDGIILDTVSPSVSSFSINNGGTTSSSASVTLNSSYTGADVMRISTDGGATWSSWYNASAAMSWTLNTSNGYGGYGAKKVMVQFSDWAGFYTQNTTTQLAGHDTDTQDSIFYGNPVISNSYKGTLTYGYIRTYYELFNSDTGSPNTFEIWYATSPTGTKIKKGETTSTSYFSASDYTAGTLYYLFVRVYNPAIGYSNFSSYSIGYGSNIAVIYDDNDPNDTILANAIKGRITTNWVNTSSNVFNQGSYLWEDYTVTLVPEDEISSTYFVDSYNTTVVHGDPVVITPSASTTYSIANKTRNIAASGHGVLGMHYTGWRFFQTLANNWSSWSMTGTSPTNLDYAYDRGTTQYAGTKEYYSQYEYIWHKYIYYDVLFNSANRDNPDYNALMFTSNTNADYAYGLAHRWSIYSSAVSGGSAESATAFYADDPDTANYYSIARQGRFVYWGYNKMPGYYYGVTLFSNIIRRLSYF